MLFFSERKKEKTNLTTGKGVVASYLTECLDLLVSKYGNLHNPFCGIRNQR